MDNLYSVLGVAQAATEAEIKRAFRMLSKKYHPDVNPGDRGAEEKFRKVSEAYSLLQNPQKRKEYDKKLEEAKRGAYQKNSMKGNSLHQGMSRVDIGDMGQKANPLDMTEMFEKYMGVPK